MIDLDQIYNQLARPWPHEELAARYASAQDRGARAIKNPRPAVDRALPMVASALPPAATLDVAVYVVHMLRVTTHDDLARRLVDNAEQSAAAALHRCHRALELDGATHSYTAEEWLPVVCDRAAELLKSARLNEEPPTMVREAQGEFFHHQVLERLHPTLTHQRVRKRALRKLGVRYIEPVPRVDVDVLRQVQRRSRPYPAGDKMRSPVVGIASVATIPARIGPA